MWMNLDGNTKENNREYRQSKVLLEVERKRRQQDKKTANAKMLDPNLYPGGLEHKEARDA